MRRSTQIRFGRIAAEDDAPDEGDLGRAFEGGRERRAQGGGPAPRPTGAGRPRRPGPRRARGRRRRRRGRWTAGCRRGRRSPTRGRRSRRRTTASARTRRGRSTACRTRQRRAEVQEDLEVRAHDGRRHDRDVDALHAALRVHERALLARERRDRQDDVGGVRQRVALPGVDDEDARLAQTGDERGVVALLAEMRVGDVEDRGKKKRRKKEDEDFFESKRERGERSVRLGALEAGRLAAPAVRSGLRLRRSSRPLVPDPPARPQVDDELGCIHLQRIFAERREKPGLLGREIGGAR